jgi:hypothetical protein
MALGSVLGYLSGANSKWHEYVVKIIIQTPIVIDFFLYSVAIA